MWSASRPCPTASWKSTPPQPLLTITGIGPAGAGIASSILIAPFAVSRPSSSGVNASYSSRPVCPPRARRPIWRTPPRSAVTATVNWTIRRSSSARMPSELAITTRWTMSEKRVVTWRTSGPAALAAAFARSTSAARSSMVACSAGRTARSPAAVSTATSRTGCPDGPWPRATSRAARAADSKPLRPSRRRRRTRSRCQPPPERRRRAPGRAEGAPAGRPPSRTSWSASVLGEDVGELAAGCQRFGERPFDQGRIERMSWRRCVINGTRGRRVRTGSTGPTSSSRPRRPRAHRSAGHRSRRSGTRARSARSSRRSTGATGGRRRRDRPCACGRGARSRRRRRTAAE